jgi:hypothetical protein
MKKRLTNFSMAFIAATLLLINPFGAAAQMSHPNQTWDRTVRVREKPRATVSTTQDLIMCSDAQITFAFDVSSATKTLEVSTTGNADKVTFTFTGADNLYVTFQMLKNSTPLTESEYAGLNLPSAVWDGTNKTITCPLDGFTTTSLALSVLPVGSAQKEDIYRLEMKSIKALSSSSPCAEELLTGIYATVKVKTMPDVTITNPNLTICDGDTLDIGIAENQMTIGGGTTTPTPIFDFHGEDPATNSMTMEYQISAINPTTNSLTTNPAFNNSTPITIPTGTTTASNFDVVITPVSAGKYQFAITKLTANGCVRNITVGEKAAILTVRPLPTISFPEDDICEGGSMLVTFTGAVGITAFDVDYKYTLNSGTNLIEPDVVGLPGTFSSLTEGSTDNNGVKTYTKNITTGQAGDFHFYLHTVSDGTCTSTNPNSPSWKWWQ